MRYFNSKDESKKKNLLILPPIFYEENESFYRRIRTVGTSPTFCLYGPRRKGAQQEEDCNMRNARRSTSFKYTTWIPAMQCNVVGKKEWNS